MRRRDHARAPVRQILIAAAVGLSMTCSARRSRSACSAWGVGAADPRGRPAHPPGEDGHADDGRHRDHRGIVAGYVATRIVFTTVTAAGIWCCSRPCSSGVLGFLDDFIKVRRRARSASRRPRRWPARP